MGGKALENNNWRMIIEERLKKKSYI